VSKLPEDIKELAEIIWDECREGNALLDSRGVPNYIKAVGLARTFLNIAKEVGIEDPLHDVDWKAIIDCSLEYGELINEVKRYLYTAFSPEAPAKVYERASEIDLKDYLRMELSRIEHDMDYLQSLSPEELQEQGMTEEDRKKLIDDLTRERAEILQKLRELERPKPARRVARRPVRKAEKPRYINLLYYMYFKPKPKPSRPPEKPAERPVERPPEEAPVKTPEKPVERPPEKVTEKPPERPAEKPSEEAPVKPPVAQPSVPIGTEPEDMVKKLIRQYWTNNMYLFEQELAKAGYKLVAHMLEFPGRVGVGRLGKYYAYIASPRIPRPSEIIELSEDHVVFRTEDNIWRQYIIDPETKTYIARTFTIIRIQGA